MQRSLMADPGFHQSLLEVSEDGGRLQLYRQERGDGAVPASTPRGKNPSGCPQLPSAAVCCHHAQRGSCSGLKPRSICSSCRELKSSGVSKGGRHDLRNPPGGAPAMGCCGTDLTGGTVLRQPASVWQGVLLK